MKVIKEIISLYIFTIAITLISWLDNSAKNIKKHKK